LVIWYLNFDIVSSFDIRISDFEVSSVVKYWQPITEFDVSLQQEQPALISRDIYATVHARG